MVKPPRLLHRERTSYRPRDVLDMHFWASEILLVHSANTHTHTNTLLATPSLASAPSSPYHHSRIDFAFGALQLQCVIHFARTKCSLLLLLPPHISLCCAVHIIWIRNASGAHCIIMANRDTNYTHTKFHQRRKYICTDN